MFRPQEMCRAELVVPEQDVVEVTETLAASGAFHHTPAGNVPESSAPQPGGDWQSRAMEFSSLEQRIVAVMEALNVDEGQPPGETPHLIKPSVARRDVEHLEEEARTYVEELQEQRQKLEELQRYISQLELIENLNIDLEAVRNLRYVTMLIGTMPLVNLDRLRSSLERIPSALTVLRRGQHLATVVLVGTRRDAEIIQRAARSAYLNPLKLPDTYRGTPSEVLAALRAGVERAQKRIEQDEAAIQRLHEKRIQHLRHLLWRVRASRKLVETISSYGRLRYNYLVTGWVPTSAVDDLRRQLEAISEKLLFEVTRQRPTGEMDDVPVAFTNPYPFRGFQQLVTTYGYPRYNEMDPTILLTFTFPLVFGVMFGDVGHGLLLVLIGLLLASRRISALEGLSGLGSVAIACGLSATLFGLAYGVVLGFERVLPVLWVRPLENVQQTLLFAILIGAGLLSLGMLSHMFNAALVREWGDLLFDRNGLAGLAFYWSLFGLTAEVFGQPVPVSRGVLIALAITSGLGVAFGETLASFLEARDEVPREELSTQLLQAPFELFETLIGLLSNTLSYVRMGAFAVAHGALASVVFILAEQVDSTGGVGYWVTVGLGNLFVVGFEGLIVTIQTLRLEYYEFFSKFFSGEGMGYSPFSLVPREER